MSIDYGNDYATILEDGRLVLDLSPIRITGPIVPVVRVARAWLALIGGAIESTYTPSQLNTLSAQCLAAALEQMHVLAVDNMIARLADKRLTVSGDITVGGDQTYPLNVSIGALGEALARLS